MRYQGAALNLHRDQTLGYYQLVGIGDDHMSTTCNGRASRAADVRR